MEVEEVVDKTGQEEELELDELAEALEKAHGLLGLRTISRGSALAGLVSMHTQVVEELGAAGIQRLGLSALGAGGAGKVTKGLSADGKGGLGVGVEMSKGEGQRSIRQEELKDVPAVRRGASGEQAVCWGREESASRSFFSSGGLVEDLFLFSWRRTPDGEGVGCGDAVVCWEECGAWAPCGALEGRGGGEDWGELAEEEGACLRERVCDGPSQFSSSVALKLRKTSGHGAE